MGRRGRIVVVEEEVKTRTALVELLRHEGYEIEIAADAPEALATCESFGPHVVIVDLETCGMDGVQILKKLRSMEDPAAVVVMTAFGEASAAVGAMRAGAAEYLTTPPDLDTVRVVVDRVFSQQELLRENRELRARVGGHVAPANLVGASPSMQRVLEIVDQVAPSKATVMLMGESGTGKELVANVVHQRSPRATGPFIKLHCAAFAETLLDSELFGHEKGAFTGAMSRKDGRLVLADGGTLFVDEIGEISPAIQAKLLRFLQEGEFERVGGTQTLRVDVRIIAATNRNLVDEVAKGRFLEDLLRRLNLVALEIPPLRDRRSDIPALAKFFLDRYSKVNGKHSEGFAPETLALLTSYDWPGNVRELETAIERAVVLSTEPLIGPRFLPASVQPRPLEGMPSIPGTTMADLERYAILETLKANGGSTSKTAEMLGISVRTIQYRLHQYNEASHAEVDVVRRDRSLTRATRRSLESA